MTALSRSLLTPQCPMVDTDDLDEINRRIAILRDNLRNLVEQAAAYSGAADDARISERIADMEAKLAELLKQRDAVSMVSK